jgi:hypothetical protein
MLRALLKDPLLKEKENCSEQIPTNNDRVANRTLSFTRTFVYREAGKQPAVSQMQQAPETASHILCNCQALATLTFRHLCHHFMQPGDFEIIPVSRILHFVPGVGPLDA